LAKYHGHELTPTRKTARMALRARLLHRLMEIGLGNQWQNLAEDATKLIHEGFPLAFWSSQT
jgi:hypothetical protein